MTSGHPYMGLQRWGRARGRGIKSRIFPHSQSAAGVSHLSVCTNFSPSHTHTHTHTPTHPPLYRLPTVQATPFPTLPSTPICLFHFLHSLTLPSVSFIFNTSFHSHLSLPFPFFKIFNISLNLLCVKRVLNKFKGQCHKII